MARLTGTPFGRASRVNSTRQEREIAFSWTKGPPVAVIVDYRSGAAVRRCVESLVNEGIKEILVVDNAVNGASNASLVGLEGSCKVVEPGNNLGYGAGANFAAKHAGSGDLLVCNADVEFHKGSVLSLAEALSSNDDLAIVGPKILGIDGKLYPSARRFPDLVDSMGHAFVGVFWPNNPWSRRYTMAEWDHETTREVDWVSGACFLIREVAWETLGGFDESYFMYAEDVDLCWRARLCGWKVGYEPKSQVTHVQGKSTQLHPGKMLVAHHKSLLRFASRTTVGWRRVLLPVVTVGLGLRLVITAARTLGSKGASK